MAQSSLKYYTTIPNFSFYSTVVHLKAKGALALLLDAVPEYKQYPAFESEDFKVYFFSGNICFDSKTVSVVVNPNFENDHATLFRFGVKEKDVSLDLYNAILDCL